MFNKHLKIEKNQNKCMKTLSQNTIQTFAVECIHAFKLILFNGNMVMNYLFVITVNINEVKQFYFGNIGKVCNK